MRREAEFQTLFRHWLRANLDKFPLSAAFELKQTTGTSIPFSAVEDHQMAALIAAERSGILYKAPDDSRGVKPFDFFFLKGADAFIAVRFPDFFCIIGRHEWEREARISERKSLTDERARVISTLVIPIGRRGARMK